MRELSTISEGDPRLRHRGAPFHRPPGINYRYTPTYVPVESHGASLKYAPSANALSVMWHAPRRPVRFSNLPPPRPPTPRRYRISSVLSQ